MEEVDCMNKNDILEVLKRYNFDNNKYIVISGAAMVLLGIKDETTDIDIAVTDEYKKKLLENYKCHFERINEYGETCYMIDDVINFSVTYYEDNKEYVEKIPIQPIESILDLKQQLNRSKDESDILLLRKKIRK